jgi:hypothetical protein
VTETVKALIMVPPSGASRAERWIAGGRNAAALDLIHVLHSLEAVNEIHVLVGDNNNQEIFNEFSVESVSTSEVDFKFGDALLKFATEQNPGVLIYFGAGSAPLLSRSTVEISLNKVLQSGAPSAVVNNFHSTDWAIFNSPKQIGGITHRLLTDNQLGWVMKNEGGFEVGGLPFSAETRMDIDTPTDLIMLANHPDLGAAIREYLSKNSVEANNRLSAIQDLLKTPAKTLTLIGRSSSNAWRALEAQTQIWIRVFAEERGMVASGRLLNGQVRSLFAEIVDVWGIEAVIDFLASISDGVLWDNRVWMGHNKSWPKVADRYAADLGWVDEIEDPTLREVTEHVVNASIPITTGGHGIVSGGVMVLLDSLAVT